jgi:hypothetical protein
MPTDVQGLFALLASVDLKTVLALVTAIITVTLFLKRVGEEARKARIARLETRSLDQLFKFREQLISCLDRFEDLPDVVDDSSAQTFWTTLRAIRHDLRRSIDEHALFAAADEYQEHARAFSDADKSYRAIAEDLALRRIDYNIANRFKRIVYQLLEAADIRIVRIQELDGRSRAREQILIRSNYDGRIAEIDELLRQPDQWIPVRDGDSATSRAAAST